MRLILYPLLLRWIAPAQGRASSSSPNSKARAESTIVESSYCPASAAVPNRATAAVEIMGFEYAESARPIPVCADRRLRVDEPPPTAGH